MEGGESFVCDQCGKTFQTSKVSPPLQRGQCVEGGESFVCDQCGKVFQTSKVSAPSGCTIIN